MKLYEYIITRDYGFAPNPFYQVCTLSTCKPKIRNTAKKGDWIAGFGGCLTQCRGRLVYLMRVSEKITFDEYWEDEKFLKKRPDFSKSTKACYGDNIYHKNEKGEWMQANSHHSFEDGINYVNLKKDTSCNNILIADKFWYFGNNACKLPECYNSLIPKCRGHQIVLNQDDINSLINWVAANYDEGMNGLPFSWSGSIPFKRFAGD